jgi:pimeloyl-ACP methyl ester carboxylesterase
MPEPVVLVHGLWMPAAAMTVLAARLSRAGYAPRRFAYAGRRSLEDNVERLARFARTLPAPAHFIGHSLGGVLVLETLNRHRGLPARSALLLGAPASGCLAGRRLGRVRMGRWMMGACGTLWESRRAVWTRPEPLGVIAGTLPLGLGRILGRLPERNDGVVCLSETEVAGMTDRTLVATGHSTLIFSARVAALAGRFLAVGRFA